MYATIQSKKFNEFACRIYKEPVTINEQYKVYKLVDSFTPNDIILKEEIGENKIFRYLAIDNQNILYLYDNNQKKCEVKMGLCGYYED